MEPTQAGCHDTQQNDTQLIILSNIEKIHAECYYDECRYAKHRSTQPKNAQLNNI
jgi:hypothetical protein